MKWILVLVFITAQLFAQSLIDFSDCCVQDFKKVKGDIIIAFPIDTFRSFQKYTIVKVIDSAVVDYAGTTNTQRFLLLKDLTGKQFIFLSKFIYYQDIYDAQLFMNKISKNKYKFYYKGEKDKIAGLQRFGLYELIDVMYNDIDNSSYFVLRSGNKKYYVDKYDFTKNNFYSTIEYNEKVNKYGYTYGRDILEGVVRIGMTFEMVIESWGSPNNVSEYVTTYGNFVTYSYSFGTVTFLNGRVNTIYTR